MERSKPEFVPRMKTRASGESVKIEVAGGDFSPLVNHPRETKGAGDVVTEYVRGTSESSWGKQQMVHSEALEVRGAKVQTGVDMTDPGHLREATAGLPIGKIKAENIHSAHGEGADTAGLIGGLFASARESLAPGGVLEYGMTGPLTFPERKGGGLKLHDAFAMASEHGFEPVEVRSGMTFGHTFSQSEDGMRDRRRVQVVFARSEEAEMVRGYYADKQGVRGEGSGSKMRALVASGMSDEETVGAVREHHAGLEAFKEM